MKKLDQSGSHIIAIVLAIFVAGTIGFAGYNVYSKKNKTHNDNRNNQSSPDQASLAHTSQTNDVSKDCSGKGTVTLTHAPMDMSDVSVVLPVGTLAGAHVTPIDHMYFYPKDMTNRDAAPVYAMADGFIVTYGERTQKVDNGAAQKAEYRIDIQHTCDFATYFDLLTSMEPSLAKQISDKGGKDLHIPVKAGQVIGRVGAQSLDTAVYNYAVTLKGFANPKSYAEVEPWKLHTDDLFKYFKDPIKSEILAKNLRKVEPFGGKIDYDIDGKLIGNWFEVGTNGYAGPKELHAQSGSNGKGYWSGHFSIAPDAIDPTVTDISFGDYQGKATQFSAKKGSLDPATVSPESGMVKYELVDYSVPSPSPTGTQAARSQQERGTVLFQLTGKQSLKIEAFPGKTAEQVSGFTSNAKTYER